MPFSDLAHKTGCPTWEDACFSLKGRLLGLGPPVDAEWLVSRACGPRPALPLCHCSGSIVPQMFSAARLPEPAGTQGPRDAAPPAPGVVVSLTPLPRCLDKIRPFKVIITYVKEGLGFPRSTVGRCHRENSPTARLQLEKSESFPQGTLGKIPHPVCLLFKTQSEGLPGASHGTSTCEGHEASVTHVRQEPGEQPSHALPWKGAPPR